MRLPRVPSLQHASRMIDKDPSKVAKQLWRLAENSPRINYVPSQPLCRDHLRLGVGAEHVLRAVQSITGDRQRNANFSACSAFLAVAPLVPRGRFIEVEVKHFALGRNLHVPVNPFLYQMGSEGNHLLWVSFWADLVLTEVERAFFWTILETSFFRSPDYRGDKLCFLDLGRQEGSEREPILISGSSFPTMSMKELKEYSDSFVEAYLEVRAKILKRNAEEKGEAVRIIDPSEPMHLEQPF